VSNTGLAPTALPPLALRRADALTDVLTSPVRSVTPTGGDRRDLARRMHSALEGLRREQPSRARLTVTDYLLRAGGAMPSGGTGPSGRLGPSGPFRWSARGARRVVGLAAARRCLSGASRTPVDAAGEVIGELATEGERGLGRPGSVGRWLAGLPAAGRAAVQVEAANWCTALSDAVDWRRLAGAEVGPPDRWWEAAGVAVRSRADLRVPRGEPGDRAGTALLTVVAGWPGTTSQAALGLPALVAAVDGGDIPARVVGWWPECGRAVAVDVDRGFLDVTATAVVDTVRRVLTGG